MPNPLVALIQSYNAKGKGLLSLFPDAFTYAEVLDAWYFFSDYRVWA